MIYMAPICHEPITRARARCQRVRETSVAEEDLVATPSMHSSSPTQLLITLNGVAIAERVAPKTIIKGITADV